MPVYTSLSAACDCDGTGSLNEFCNQLTGQCPCRPNTYGQQCNECQPGFWNFPNCQRCNCNGHADICDPRTGECIDCQSNTAGFECERYINRKTKVRICKQPEMALGLHTIVRVVVTVP